MATYTKTELVATLRDLRQQLYSPQVEARVKELDFSDRQDFVAARLHLTELITEVNQALMRDIREELEKQSPALRQGIASLKGSLDRLNAANQWAGAVNQVVGVLGRIVPLI